MDIKKGATPCSNLYYEKHIAKIRTLAKSANYPSKKVCFITSFKKVYSSINT